jgi:CheY-like chemotaxis protein
LAGGVAHDFNNLLTAILGYARIVADGRLDEEQRHDVEEIIKASERASALTRRLLTFSRHQVVETTRVELAAVVDDLGRMLRRLIGSHIEMRTELPSGLGRVRADRSQIEQVVMNLVLNARDAMPDGGSLEIRASNVELDEASLSVRGGVKAGAYVMLAVSDTGIGMSEETKAHMFEPFFSTKEKDGGTGLGLSTVYAIVSQSGGYVSFDSEIGRGTTFTVYLPRAEDETIVPPAVAEPMPRELGGTEVVLLVEDEDGVRALARGILERAGFSVVEARSPAEAESVFASHEADVDVLVTDIVMPGGTGTQLYHRLIERKSSLRAIFMSGYTGGTSIDRGDLAAGVAFLDKPFTAAGLVRAVREVLDR